MVRLECARCTGQLRQCFSTAAVIATGFSGAVELVRHSSSGRPGLRSAVSGRSMSPTRSTTGSLRSRSLRSATSRSVDGGVHRDLGRRRSNAPLGLDDSLRTETSLRRTETTATPSRRPPPVSRSQSCRWIRLNAGGDLFGLTLSPSHKGNPVRRRREQHPRAFPPVTCRSRVSRR